MIHWLWFKSLLIPCRIRSVRPSNTKTMCFYLKSCYCSDTSNAFLPDPSWDIVKRHYIPGIMNMQHIMSAETCLVRIFRHMDSLHRSSLRTFGDWCASAAPSSNGRCVCLTRSWWYFHDEGNNETLTLCYKYDVFVYDLWLWSMSYCLRVLFAIFCWFIYESGGKAFNGLIQIVESEAVCMKVKIKVRSLRWTHQ